MRVAVILPSRGQIFSRTWEHILNNVSEHAYRIYWSHGQKIPDCFNKPLQQALKDSQNTHFWFVEEDMIIPDETLSKMLNMNKPAVTCNYPVTKYGTPSVSTDPDGKIYTCGTGCLLVTREFLTHYQKPIFRSDIQFTIRNRDNCAEFTAIKTDGNKVYGMHDIFFSLLAYFRNKPIILCDIECGQYKLIQSGATGINSGVHKIEKWTKLVSPGIFKENEPEIDDVLIKLNDGTQTCVTKEKAYKLIKNKLAEEIKKDYVYLTNPEVLSIL